MHINWSNNLDAIETQHHILLYIYISQEKRLRRKYEWKYKQSKLTVDELQLQAQRNKYNVLLNSTKKDYIKNKIENAESSTDLYEYAISF